MRSIRVEIPAHQELSGIRNPAAPRGEQGRGRESTFSDDADFGETASDEEEREDDRAPADPT